MAAPFTCPDHIESSLKSHDSRLSVEWNPISNSYEILYLRTGFPKPDQRDVRWIRAADTQNQRPKDVIRECVESKEKWDEARKKEQLHHGKESFGDAAYRWAIKRNQVGYGS